MVNVPSPTGYWRRNYGTKLVLPAPVLLTSPKVWPAFRSGWSSNRLGSLSIGRNYNLPDESLQMVQVLSAIFFHIIPSLNQFLELTEGSLPCLIDQDKVRQHSKGLGPRETTELEGHHWAETNLASLHEVKARPQNQDRTQPQHEAMGACKGNDSGQYRSSERTRPLFSWRSDWTAGPSCYKPESLDAFHCLQDLIAELWNGIPSLIHLGFKGWDTL